MRKPKKRPDLPSRRSDNDNRKLDTNPNSQKIAELLGCAHYVGSSKHKRNPHLFGLRPSNGKRGDETLCDEHAGFAPDDMQSVSAMLQRGLRAGLVGGRVIWAVADNGWIFEARLTNVVTFEYHGYPSGVPKPSQNLFFDASPIGPVLMEARPIRWLRKFARHCMGSGMTFKIDIERDHSTGPDDPHRIAIRSGARVFTHLLRGGANEPDDYLVAPPAQLAFWIIDNWWRLRWECIPVIGMTASWRLAHDLLFNRRRFRLAEFIHLG